jgi:hypothetical protein
LEKEYSNGDVLRKLLSENTTKYHRRKTEEEEAGEAYSRHLKRLEAAHVIVCQIHEDEVGTGAEEDLSTLAQFLVSDYATMNEEFISEHFAAHEKAVLEGKDAYSDDDEGGGKRKGKGKGKAKGEETRRGQTATRKVHGTLVGQLAVAFLNRSQHYHESGLCDQAQHASWMPGYQGVSFPFW